MEMITFDISFQEITSICLRGFPTSNRHVAADARLPATKPADKFTPRTVAALASSPVKLRSLLLICPIICKTVIHSTQNAGKQNMANGFKNKFSLAQGSTNRLQRKEHHEQAVPQGLSTGHGSSALQ